MMDEEQNLINDFWIQAATFTSNLLNETGLRVAQEGLSEREKAVEFILAQRNYRTGTKRIHLSHGICSGTFRLDFDGPVVLHPDRDIRAGAIRTARIGELY